jgi:dTDP-4-dehydrorhamnose reductase
VTTRVVVTGALGQVGVDLVDTLRAAKVPGGSSDYLPDGRPVAEGEFEVFALSRRDLDVTDERAVELALAAAGADVLVNLAAYTAVDRAEDDLAACAAINRDAVATLSALCASSGTHLVTLSTDYVFDGRKGAAYLEADPTGPLNVYGFTKLEGERLCAPSHTIVRTSWVMGARGRNVARGVLQRLRAGEAVSFVDDQRGTPTLAADLARAIVAIVRERPEGIWHLVNEGSATWFDVAVAVAEIASFDTARVRPMSSDALEPPPRARRPARSDLSTAKWSDAGWATLPPWRESLRRLIDDC